MFLFKRKPKRDRKPEVLVSEQLPEAAPAMPAAPTPDPVAPKRRRPATANKTRLMGFDTADGRVVDLFGEDKKTSDAKQVQFPVAIVMVIKGPGRGESFALQSGMSQIGRGEDQAVQLDFGDTAISRSNHAAIVYDPVEHSFLLGHGGKSNIVRLNGKPVVSTSDLTDGDEIEIGQTTMRFAALCSDAFNWNQAEGEEGDNEDDMEIA
jgi:hypothetical protein